jgi:hypothetical protein
LQTKLTAFNPVTHQRTFYNSVVPTGTNLCATPSAGFSCAPLDQIGNTGRNSNFGPGFFNTDLALQKNFPIKESLFAQFRVDFANVFNHINAGNPGGNIENTGTIGGGVGINGNSNPRQLTFSARLQF